MLVSKRYETFKICEKDGIVLSTFEGAKLANHSLPGDSVRPLETGSGCELVERAQHPPLVGVIEFQSKIKYGYSGRNNPIYLFKPFDESYPPMLVGSKETTRTNQIGIAAFDGWDAGSTFPRAVLQKIIGPCGDRMAETEAVLAQYSPWQWGKKQLNTPFVTVSGEGRYDLTEKPTINIDPEGCQDIDDCISLWKEETKWILAISIADVAAFLDVNPNILAHAEKIGQTMYMDGRAVRPLLPPVLSENALSLLAGEIRNTITLFAEWYPQRGLTNFQWRLTTLKNKASYTYENCYSAKEIPIDILADISSHLIGRKETDSHKWIESFMILYNEKAAEILWEMKSGFLRGHSDPDRERFEKFERLSLPGKELAFPAAVYMNVLGKEKESLKHFGLNKGLYCHASSPIRRFPDILNQFVLHAYLETKNLSQTKYTAFQLNLLMKKGKAFERDYHFIQVLFEKNSCYEKGIVVSVNEKVEVYIPSWKRICKIKTDGIYSEGQEVQVAFYVNMAERNWKQRILMRLDTLTA